MFSHGQIRQLLCEAYHDAAQSPDPSNQNGALVVDDYGQILARSYNHVPHADAEELAWILGDRDRKLQHICHAEEAATIVAAKIGVATRDKILVCPWFACTPCARKILLAGYKMVIGHQPRMNTTPERWRADVDNALEWLLRARVDLYFYGEHLPDAPTIHVNGQVWQP